MFEALLVYLIVAIAIAAASITLTRARIFKPLRDRAMNSNYLLFKLVSCPYCMSHWLAAVFVPWTLFTITDIVWLDGLMTWFFLIGLAAVFEGFMMNQLHMQENYIQELEDEISVHEMKLVEAREEAAKEAAATITEHREAWTHEGARLERERYAATDVKLREPLKTTDFTL